MVGILKKLFHLGISGHFAHPHSLWAQTHRILPLPGAGARRGCSPVDGTSNLRRAVGIDLVSIRFKNRMADINWVPVLPENNSPQMLRSMRLGLAAPGCVKNCRRFYRKRRVGNSSVLLRCHSATSLSGFIICQYFFFSILFWNYFGQNTKYILRNRNGRDNPLRVGFVLVLLCITLTSKNIYIRGVLIWNRPSSMKA